jgi:hypothetical protein
MMTVETTGTQDGTHPGTSHVKVLGCSRLQAHLDLNRHGDIQIVIALCDTTFSVYPGSHRLQLNSAGNRGTKQDQTAFRPVCSSIFAHMVSDISGRTSVGAGSDNRQKGSLYPYVRCAVLPGGSVVRVGGWTSQATLLTQGLGFGQWPKPGPREGRFRSSRQPSQPNPRVTQHQQYTILSLKSPLLRVPAQDIREV